MLGISLFELALRESVLAIIVFNFLFTLCVAYFFTFGARIGLRQMMLSRFSFGYYVLWIPAVLNVIATIGIVIVAIFTFTPAFAGYKCVHLYERWLTIIPAVIFVILLGQIAKALEAAGRYTHPSNYCANLSHKRSGLAIFLATDAGVNFLLILIESLDAALMARVKTCPGFAAIHDAHALGGVINIVLSQGPSSMKGFGGLLTISLGLGFIANNIFSFSLTVQLFGKYFQAIPRFLFEEHLIVCKGRWSNYDFDVINDPSKLPLGIEEFLALACGIPDAFFGMAQTWYIGVIGCKGHENDKSEEQTTTSLCSLLPWYSSLEEFEPGLLSSPSAANTSNANVPVQPAVPLAMVPASVVAPPGETSRPPVVDDDETESANSDDVSDAERIAAVEDGDAGGDSSGSDDGDYAKVWAKFKQRFDHAVAGKEECSKLLEKAEKKKQKLQEEIDFILDAIAERRSARYHILAKHSGVTPAEVAKQEQEAARRARARQGSPHRSGSPYGARMTSPSVSAGVTNGNNRSGRPLEKSRERTASSPSPGSPSYSHHYAHQQQHSYQHHPPHPHHRHHPHDPNHRDAPYSQGGPRVSNGSRPRRSRSPDDLTAPLRPDKAYLRHDVGFPSLSRVEHGGPGSGKYAAATRRHSPPPYGYGHEPVAGQKRGREGSADSGRETAVPSKRLHVDEY
ncbi:hypothetical protein K437DRAFT_261917 [Tilletiaria anomala UBC 951]|uniref:Uncharacterized protein n=1 Tax=Tilletiaria anomala (strain ATCC 24038 / CBS 436.72 / UBC 951) TaxID=1037660 RepID=A0A066W9H9_TILAU|nr:uncharacterized protein K437DRAFT_261917 [Tilletiaria anomala UBC 951]KDN50356.1 hypothetical protein K437DRAFT_261917 [Tilletiaria anomala UBC 951]